MTRNIHPKSLELWNLMGFSDPWNLMVMSSHDHLGGGNSNIFWNFHPYIFGEDEPILTN